MDREVVFSALYNHYYTHARQDSSDTESSVYAYDQASTDMTDLDRQELRMHLKMLGIQI